MSASAIRKLILSLGTVAVLAGSVLGTAQAGDDHWRGERDWRHERWEQRRFRPPVVYGPSVVYGPPVVYAVPGMVYAPPPAGITVVLPIKIR